MLDCSKITSIDFCRNQLRQRLGSFKRKNSHELFEQPAVENNNQDAAPLDIETTITPRNADDAPVEIKQPVAKKTLRFFAIIVAISFTGLLTALEATITSTALPTVISDLGGANLYSWVVNVYFLAQWVFSQFLQPIAKPSSELVRM